MPDGLSDKLQGYFRDLAPGARAMFGAAIARAGDTLPHADLILGALKDAMRHNGEIVDTSDLQALVLAPCRPFTVQAAKLTKAPGVIMQGSLDSVWRWLEKSAATAAIAKFRAGIEADVFGRMDPQSLVTLRNACSKAIQDTLKSAGDSREASRLASLLGSDSAAEDLEDIGAALRYAPLLDTVSDDLAQDLKLLPDEIVAAIRHRLAGIARKAKPAHALVLHGLKRRIGNPVATIRMMVALADASSGDGLMKSPYVSLLEMVLQDVERAVGRAQVARAGVSTDELAAAIREFGTALRAIDAELDLESRSSQARRINGFRKGMSEALGARMMDITQRAKQLVRPKSDAKGGSSTIDKLELDRLDGDIAVLMAARNFAEDMALKADTLRIYSEIKDLLDTGAPLLIDRLRSTPMGERGPIRERLEAVARISRRLLGEEYAGLLIKAVMVADVPPPQRKAS